MVSSAIPESTWLSYCEAVKQCKCDVNNEMCPDVAIVQSTLQATLDLIPDTTPVLKTAKRSEALIERSHDPKYLTRFVCIDSTTPPTHYMTDFFIHSRNLQPLIRAAHILHRLCTTKDCCASIELDQLNAMIEYVNLIVKLYYN